MPSETACDILVVGAGPAGLAAARSASASGARTLLVERGGEIGAPVRTSGGTWLADLDRLQIPRSLAHLTPTIRVVGPGSSAEWTFQPARLGVLDVRATWQHLARRAIEAGAEIRLRHAATGPILDEAGIVRAVRVRDDRGRDLTIQCQVAIDASGGACALGVPAGLRKPPVRQGVGAELELLAPRYDQSVAMLLVGRGLAPRGYAWAFPRGEGRVRLGVGILRPDSHLDPRALLERLRTSATFEGALEGAQPLEYHAGTFPSDGPLGARSSPGLLLAGDSAAQGSLVLGEGIRYALEAGLLAGRAAAVAVSTGNASAPLAHAYDRLWQRRHGREEALAIWLNRRAARYGDRNWRVVLALLRVLPGPFVAEALHGDFSVEWLARLLLHSPALGLAAARALRSHA
ncbi:MAG: NAD(P)/FAD-dependent oxidoreductase [Chloroflexi bacterium]|nr:NAD(P)/FAD-dependent oxidoreductase [Chloroflexota bacterium]